MPRWLRDRNPGMQPTLVSIIQLSAAASDFGLTRHGILVSPRATVPTFARKRNRPCLAGRSLGDYRQFLLGQDISFALHHLQLWAEFYEVRFQVPRIGDVDTFAYYLEGKYKFTPQFFGALRWNQQLFGDDAGDRVGPSLGHDLWRVDTSLAYRFTAHTQLKLQYSFQDASDDSRDLVHTLAAQFTVRF